MARLVFPLTFEAARERRIDKVAVMQEALSKTSQYRTLVTNSENQTYHPGCHDKVPPRTCIKFIQKYCADKRRDNEHQDNQSPLTREEEHKCSSDPQQDNLNGPRGCGI